MQTNSSPAQRRQIAYTALQELGRQRDGHRMCNVRCSRSHRVAAVFATPVGPVYASLSGPHAHGRRDFVATGHHDSSRGRVVVDLLDPGDDQTVEDELPAWCECGPRTLSRAELQDAVATHRRNLLVT